MADHAYILCHFADESSLYTSWLDRLPVPYTIVQELAHTWTPPDDASIVITHMHYRWEDLSGLRKLLTEHPHIPLLVLADGVLEYRNTWQNQGIPDASMFQPLFGHKVACLGKSQARILESWGNVGKCEIIGLPRLDAWAAESASRPAINSADRESTDAFELLIATAQTPAFNDQQYSTVVHSLQELQRWLNEHPTIDGRPIKLLWRLTAGLDEELGLPVNDHPSEPMADVLDRVDGVITTPSTVYLESALKGRPTAVLDYHNTPAYVPPAWTISANAHIGPVIRELVNPPAAKLLFQATTLSDGLEHRTPATDRMIDLILTMIACGNAALATGSPIEYPYRIIADADENFFPVLESFDIEQLFPNAAEFKSTDLRQLQIELNAATKRIGELPIVVQQQFKELENFRDLLDTSRQRREKMFNNLKALQKRCRNLKAKLDAQ